MYDRNIFLIVSPLETQKQIKYNFKKILRGLL